jgi:hypothetical protein
MLRSVCCRGEHGVLEPDEYRKYLKDELRQKTQFFEEIGLTVDPQLLKMARDAQAAAAEWMRQLKELEATRQLEREFLPELAMHGWLLSPSGPANQPQVLKALFQDGGIAAVDKYLIDLVDANACQVIVDNLTKRPAFAPWRTVFNKAAAALQRGDHELAIPIWLAGLDSACLNELGLSDFFSKGEAQQQVALTAQIDGLSEVYEPIAIAWLKVLLGFSGKRDQGPAILNRHWVMHGNRPHIGTHKDAVQCLLALEVLGYLLDTRDDRVKKSDPLTSA